MNSTVTTLEISVQYQPAQVEALFDTLAETYGWARWLSGGLLGRWRRQLVQALPTPVSSQVRLVDLMAGGADLWPALRNRFGAGLQVAAVDSSAAMLARADKLQAGPGLSLYQADALATPLPGGRATAVTCAFGLKTLPVDEYDALAKEAERLLCPGGEVALVEFVLPQLGWQRQAMLHYLRVLGPVLSWLRPSAAAHAALAEYATVGLDLSALRRALTQAGFQRVQQRRLWPGCAVLLTGTKSPVDE